MTVDRTPPRDASDASLIAFAQNGNRVFDVDLHFVVVFVGTRLVWGVVEFQWSACTLRSPLGTTSDQASDIGPCGGWGTHRSGELVR